MLSNTGKPEIADYDEKSVQLTWAPPGSDGGRPILFYRVQMKYNKGGPTEWADVFKTDGPICQADIQNLKFESEVQFRVIAENKGNFFI